jgi:hypothetical protein
VHVADAGGGMGVARHASTVAAARAAAIGGGPCLAP